MTRQLGGYFCAPIVLIVRSANARLEQLPSWCGAVVGLTSKINIRRSVSEYYVADSEALNTIHVVEMWSVFRTLPPLH